MIMLRRDVFLHGRFGASKPKDGDDEKSGIGDSRRKRGGDYSDT